MLHRHASVGVRIGREVGALLFLVALCSCGGSHNGSMADSKVPARLACQFSAGASPEETIGPELAHGAEIPVDHIVVLMQENRSFDHYFGQLHDSGQWQAEAEPGTAVNPDPTGGPPIKAFHQSRYCELADLDHSWTGTHQSWDGGKMDGFTGVNVDPLDPTGSRTMGYYTAQDLSFYYSLYNTFAIADRYFCSVMGPTYPNRFYLIAGTSFGHITNDFPGMGLFKQPTIYSSLDTAGVTWRVYEAPFSFSLLFDYVRQHHANVAPMEQYFTDAQAGTLPQVAILDLEFDAAPDKEIDEHPPSNVQVGEAYVARAIQALMNSPVWSSSALFLTYDEHGGFYDHVPPPPACVPDDIPPLLQEGDVAAGFDRYGIRVPLVVVSPFARRHFVSHVVYDHTSILRFIELRFDLPALTRRDANADPMLELFDFTDPPFRDPPQLDPPQLDQDRFDQCAEKPATGSG